MADRLGFALEHLRCVQYRLDIITENCRMQYPVFGFEFGVRECWVKALKPHAL